MVEKQTVTFKMEPQKANDLKETAKRRGVTVSEIITAALSGTANHEGELAAKEATIADLQARLDTLEDKIEALTGNRPKYGAKLTIQVTEAEKQTLRTKAAEHGITQSQLGRMVMGLDKAPGRLQSQANAPQLESA